MSEAGHSAALGHMAEAHALATLSALLLQLGNFTEHFSSILASTPKLTEHIAIARQELSQLLEELQGVSFLGVGAGGKIGREIANNHAPSASINGDAEGETHTAMSQAQRVMQEALALRNSAVLQKEEAERARWYAEEAQSRAQDIAASNEKRARVAEQKLRGAQESTQQAQHLHKQAEMLLNIVLSSKIPPRIISSSSSFSSLHCPDTISEVGLSQANAMAARLEDEDKEVRAAACTALVSMGKAGSMHIDGVVSKLTDNEPLVREAACDALGNMHKPETASASAIANAIALALDDVQPAVCVAACRALGMMGDASVDYHGTCHKCACC